MKPLLQLRYVLSLLLILCLLATVCGSNQGQAAGLRAAQSVLPTLMLTVDDVKIHSVQGGYSWTTGTTTEVADTSTPPVLVENINPDIVGSAAQLKISFDRKPLSLNLTIWGNRSIIGKPINQDLHGNIITLPTDKGTYIYNLQATWSEGYVNYAFKIEVHRQVDELESKLEEAERQLDRYNQEYDTPEINMLLAGTISSTNSDPLITSKVILDHLRLLWKKQDDVAADALPNAITTWSNEENMQATDFEKYGYIIRMYWIQPHTFSIMTDKAKWLSSEMGFLDASIPITLTELIFYVPKGQTVPQFFYRNGTGAYTHYILDIGMLQPPYATGKYDWNVWGKELLEQDAKKPPLCHIKCMTMSELRGG